MVYTHGMEWLTNRQGWPLGVHIRKVMLWLVSYIHFIVTLFVGIQSQVCCRERCGMHLKSVIQLGST